MNLQVTVSESETATQAAEWCQHNRIDYDIEYWGWPGTTTYKFCLKRDADMIMFSLKWAE